MIKARITAEAGYRCAPEGHTVVTFAFGETVTGAVAEWAVDDDAAEPIWDPVAEKKVTGPTETKRKRGKK